MKALKYYSIAEVQDMVRETRANALQDAEQAVRNLTNVAGYSPPDFDHIRDDACDAIAALSGY